MQITNYVNCRLTLVLNAADSRVVRLKQRYDENRSQQLPAPYKRLIDEIKQNEPEENDWRTDNLTKSRRLFNCDNRRIEMHQLLITSLHSTA